MTNTRMTYKESLVIEELDGVHGNSVNFETTSFALVATCNWNFKEHTVYHCTGRCTLQCTALYWRTGRTGVRCPLPDCPMSQNCDKHFNNAPGMAASHYRYLYRYRQGVLKERGVATHLKNLKNRGFSTPGGVSTEH